MEDLQLGATASKFRKWRLIGLVAIALVCLGLLGSIILIIVELERIPATAPVMNVDLTQMLVPAVQKVQLSQTADIPTTPAGRLTYPPFIPPEVSERFAGSADELNRKVDEIWQMIVEFEADKSTFAADEHERRIVAIETKYDYALGDFYSALPEDIKHEIRSGWGKLSPEMEMHSYAFSIWSADAKAEALARQGRMVEAATAANHLRGYLYVQKVVDAEHSSELIEFDNFRERVRPDDDAAWDRELAYLRSSGSAEGYALFAWRTLQRRGDELSLIVFRPLNRSSWRRHLEDVREKRE